MSKRTAAILAVLMLLGTFLPGVAVYAKTSCAMPCHPVPAKCHHQPSTPSWGVSCACGHDRDFRTQARLENEGPAFSAPVMAVALITISPADRLIGADSGSNPANYSRTSIFCLTRSYRI